MRKTQVKTLTLSFSVPSLSPPFPLPARPLERARSLPCCHPAAAARCAAPSRPHSSTRRALAVADAPLRRSRHAPTIARRHTHQAHARRDARPRPSSPRCPCYRAEPTQHPGIASPRPLQTPPEPPPHFPLLLPPRGTAEPLPSHAPPSSPSTPSSLSEPASTLTNHPGTLTPSYSTSLSLQSATPATCLVGTGPPWPPPKPHRRAPFSSPPQSTKTPETASSPSPEALRRGPGRPYLLECRRRRH